MELPQSPTKPTNKHKHNVRVSRLIDILSFFPPSCHILKTNEICSAQGKKLSTSWFGYLVGFPLCRLSTLHASSIIIHYTALPHCNEQHQQVTRTVSFNEERVQHPFTEGGDTDADIFIFMISAPYRKMSPVYLCSLMQRFQQHTHTV